MLIRVSVFNNDGTCLAERTAQHYQQSLFDFSDNPLREGESLLTHLTVTPTFASISPDKARKDAIEKSYQIQKDLDFLSNRLDALRSCQEGADKEVCSESITQIAEISNEVMRLRHILQPSK